MAQTKYRGNLAAKSFPFLSSQFGQSVLIQSGDQVNALGGSDGDNNIPQAYYMHNVVPTAQGYKSVGYKTALMSTRHFFDRVIPIRDPSMVRGWLGIAANGQLFLYRAGDSNWIDITSFAGGWRGGVVSVAYASGYTYLCLANWGVFKVNVDEKTMSLLDLAGVIDTKITAITSSANYLILTDGVRVYWSSTISSEDFIPSTTTGAGSGTPADVEGPIIALVPLGSGFAIYTSVNAVIAAYSQNPRFPFIFKGASNSKGISDVQHVTYSGDEGASYAWTSAGIQKITMSGATTYLPEVTDFLSGKEIDTWDSATNKIVSQRLTNNLSVKLSYIGGRFLIISYGVNELTYALLYDTALRRWGKLKLTHAACFDVSLNSANGLTTNASASAKKTLGFVTEAGAVLLCDFDNGAPASDSILILGKFQITRSRSITLDTVMLESVETDCSVKIITSLDGKSQDIVTTPAVLHESSQLKEFGTRVTGVNHSIAIKGTFQLNSFEISSHINGRR